MADRFANPFVDHQLLSIALNSTSKFRARNLPSLPGLSGNNGKVPPCLATALAGYLAFYSQKPVRREVDRLIVERPGGGTYPVCDDTAVLDFYEAHAGCVRRNIGARRTDKRTLLGRGSDESPRTGRSGAHFLWNL